MGFLERAFEVVFPFVFIAICGLIATVGFIMMLAIISAGRAATTVEVKPGQVMACYKGGSHTVERIYKSPGRHRRPKRQEGWELEWIQFRLDQPVLIESRPVEAVTLDDRPVFLTVRLTLSLADPAMPESYVAAVVGETLKHWQEQALPSLIAQVAARYTFADALRQRAQVAEHIGNSLEAWKTTPSFGLILQSAAIVQATSPRVPKD